MMSYFSQLQFNKMDPRDVIFKVDLFFFSAFATFGYLCFKWHLSCDGARDS